MGAHRPEPDRGQWVRPEANRPVRPGNSDLAVYRKFPSACESPANLEPTFSGAALGVAERE